MRTILTDADQTAQVAVTAPPFTKTQPMGHWVISVSGDGDLVRHCKEEKPEDFHEAVMIEAHTLLIRVIEVNRMFRLRRERCLKVLENMKELHGKVGRLLEDSDPLPGKPSQDLHKELEDAYTKLVLAYEHLDEFDDCRETENYPDA
jgi:regulator of PEP synthase PpsR (kinase-PPPase family)